MNKKERLVAAIQHGTVIDHIPADKTLILSIIRDYEVVEKKTVDTPNEIFGIVKCNNPKCITNNEPMPTHFHVTDGILTCHYCEKEQDINKVELV